VLRAVAVNRYAKVRTNLPVGRQARTMWHGLRQVRAWETALPTQQPPVGGAWRRAGRAWATAGTPSCYGGYCAVPLWVNARGSDGPYVTLYTKRSRGHVRIVASRDVGPQDVVDYSAAYWACLTRTADLSNTGVGDGSAISRMRVPHKAVVKVGTVYDEQPSDPDRAVRFSRVVEGFVAISALRRVPSAVVGEASARAWCRANA
jgi:hypothetical protein